MPFFAERVTRTRESIPKLPTRPNHAEQEARAKGPTGAVRAERQDEPDDDGSRGVGGEGRAWPRRVREHLQDDQEGDRAVRNDEGGRLQEAADRVSGGDAATPEPAHPALGELLARGQRGLVNIPHFYERYFFINDEEARCKMSDVYVRCGAFRAESGGDFPISM